LIGSNNSIVNNLFFDNAGGHMLLAQPVTTVDGNLTDVDPLFESYEPDGTGNYHLRPDSPALDAAVDVSRYGITFDAQCNPRPRGAAYDIGPYE
jgi:hypothetical protein